MPSHEAPQTCRCGRHRRGACYACNLDEFVRRGGREERVRDGGRVAFRLTLPDGTETTYTRIVRWLRSPAGAAA